jgi:hypothetical protein
MELKLKVNYQQLLAAIKELSAKDYLRLKKDLAQLPEPEDPGNSELAQLLEKGPVMSDEQYSEFLENRKKFREWRTS